MSLSSSWDNEFVSSRGVRCYARACAYNQSEFDVVIIGDNDSENFLLLRSGLITTPK